MTPPDSLKARKNRFAFGVVERRGGLRCAGAACASFRLNVLQRQHEARPGRLDDRPLDDVLQLADVARPVPSLERVHHASGMDGTGRPSRRAHCWAKCSASAGMSSTRSRSGGIRDRKDVEAVVQIAPERSVLDHALEIAVRRRHDAHIHALSPRAAKALELALLQDAQQLGLHFHRDVADLVEEQRAAVRQLEPARPARDRARERALLVSEQLALEQARRAGRPRSSGRTSARAAG